MFLANRAANGGGACGRLAPAGLERPNDRQAPAAPGLSRGRSGWSVERLRHQRGLLAARELDQSRVHGDSCSAAGSRRRAAGRPKRSRTMHQEAPEPALPPNWLRRGGDHPPLEPTADTPNQQRRSQWRGHRDHATQAGPGVSCGDLPVISAGRPAAAAAQQPTPWPIAIPTWGRGWPPDCAIRQAWERTAGLVAHPGDEAADLGTDRKTSSPPLEPWLVDQRAVGRQGALTLQQNRLHGGANEDSAGSLRPDWESPALPVPSAPSPAAGSQQLSSWTHGAPRPGGDAGSSATGGGRERCVHRQKSQEGGSRPGDGNNLAGVVVVCVCVAGASAGDLPGTAISRRRVGSPFPAADPGKTSRWSVVCVWCAGG